MSPPRQEQPVRNQKMQGDYQPFLAVVHVADDVQVGVQEGVGTRRLTWT